MPDPIVCPADGTRPRARGAAGRLGRARAAGRARDARARRAARVRAARHVRGAVRRDRADRRPLARPPRASSPAAPAGGCRARRRRPTDDLAAPARGRRRVLRRRPRGRLRGARRRAGPRRRAARRRRRAASRRHARSSTARRRSPARRCMFAHLAPYVRPVLVNGVAGRRGRAARPARSRVMAFTVVDGRIVAIDVLADPERLRAAGPHRARGLIRPLARGAAWPWRAAARGRRRHAPLRVLRARPP